MKALDNKLGFPIEEVIPQIRRQLAQDSTLIVTAPPGAGKSTILPLALAHEPWLEGQKILMLEPRQLAARSIAARMSDLAGEPLGQGVGYRIRFEHKVSAQTRIEVLTEGILTRMLQSDNTLEGVGMVIFDEFHERSLFADVALALCREVQQVLRPELRILIMSATLDVPKLASMLACPVVESPGKMYPVDLRYLEDERERPIAERTAAALLRAVREEPGDALVFLPGEGEIRRCEELLRERLDEEEFVVHPLYGQLPPKQQQAAIVPDRQGKRKVVLATSIAETSLTIEGVRIVVDSGYGRTQVFNPNTGLSKLETVRISKDMADQRMGRAGRLEAGVCYRLWGLASQERMDDHRTPAIEQADLSSLVLDMRVWGTEDIGAMTWLTPPPKGALLQAQDLLHELEALQGGRITDYGRRMHKLPCHPRLAHMLIRAQELQALGLATDLAALLEERDPLAKEAGADMGRRLEALRRYRKHGSGPASMARIEKAAMAYRKLFGIGPDNGPVDGYRCGLLLSQAYPERVGQSQGHGTFLLAGGRKAKMDASDELAHEPWLAVAHLDEREGLGKIFLAAPLHLDDLLPFAQEREVVSWESRKGGMVARKEMRFGRLTLSSKPLHQVDPALVQEAICQAVEKEGEQLLNFSEQVQQWQCRVMSLGIWRPEEEWPDVRTETLLATCREWLSPYLEGVSKVDDLKRIDLLQALQYHLPYAQQQLLDELAPERLQVPSGSMIRLEYRPDGSQPVLAARLQECFGLEQTPRICNGQVGVLMHLLSPGFKPVQITSDLRSFWDNAYFEVKKELKRRYPKHVWPDDPWTAEAVRGARRRQQGS